MPPRAAHEAATASRTRPPSRWMSLPTNAATTTDPMVLTSRISPRSPTGTPKLWRIAGQAVPSIPSGRPRTTKVPRLSRSNLRSVRAGARVAVTGRCSAATPAATTAARSCPCLDSNTVDVRTNILAVRLRPASTETLPAASGYWPVLGPDGDMASALAWRSDGYGRFEHIDTLMAVFDGIRRASTGRSPRH